MSAETLFDPDDYAPITVKRIGCAACIGQGCVRCYGVGRLGVSIWRGGTLLSMITVAEDGDARHPVPMS